MPAPGTEEVPPSLGYQHKTERTGPADARRHRDECPPSSWLQVLGENPRARGGATCPLLVVRQQEGKALWAPRPPGGLDFHLDRTEWGRSHAPPKSGAVRGDRGCDRPPASGGARLSNLGTFKQRRSGRSARTALISAGAQNSGGTEASRGAMLSCTSLHLTIAFRSSFLSGDVKTRPAISVIPCDPTASCLPPPS